jgi:hypothetical protein
MELSHTVSVFVYVAAAVFFKFFLFLYLLNALFQIMQVSKASQKSLILVWLNVAIRKISCDNLFGEEMHSIHWVCPMNFRRSCMCIIALLQMISIPLMASRIDSGE